MYPQSYNCQDQELSIWWKTMVFSLEINCHWGWNIPSDSPLKMLKI
jgi:hypothetical protein